MAIKSREIILELQSTQNRQPQKVQYKLIGITNVSYSFENAIGVTQGLMRNFVHPWFLKTFTITLQGSAYIGAFKQLADATTANTPPQPNPAVLSAEQQAALVQGEKQAVAKTAAAPTMNYFQKMFTTPTAPNPGSGYYYKTEQILHLMGDIYSISESISNGDIKLLNMKAIKQSLIIKNYYDEESKSLTFTGFIESLQVVEDAKQLGVLDYTLKFQGIVEIISSGKTGDKKATDLLSLIKSAGKGVGNLSKATADKLAK
jgi:hypothetical protein